MTEVVDDLLRRIAAYKKSNTFLSTRFGQMRKDRDLWREKAIERSKLLERERRRTQQARASRDMWKHRAMTKV